MFDLSTLAGIIGAIIIITIIILIFKKGALLVINIVVGYLALFITKLFFITELPVNFLTAFLVGVFGIIGYFGVLIWHFLF